MKPAPLVGQDPGAQEHHRVRPALRRGSAIAARLALQGRGPTVREDARVLERAYGELLDLDLHAALLVGDGDVEQD